MLTAVGNTLAALPGILAPQLKLWILHVTGSWVPLFGLAAALQFMAGLMYGKSASLKPAREEVEDEDRRRLAEEDARRQ